MESPESLFQRPLILGASISANFKTEGPADRLIKKLGIRTHPIRVARSGATARHVIRKLQPSLLEKTSVVIAVDLFFWDASFPRLNRTIEALDRLLEMTANAKVPLILATVPAVAPKPLQWNREAINDAIRKKARRKRKDGVLLLDLDRMNKRIRKAGHFVVGEKSYSLRSIAPDRIHLSAEACEYVADRLFEKVQDLVGADSI
jgi:hypothetical protein